MEIVEPNFTPFRDDMKIVEPNFTPSLSRVTILPRLHYLVGQVQIFT